MNKDQKKELKSKIIEGLQSLNIKTFSDSINHLKNEGKTEDIVFLLDLLLVQKTDERKNLILKFLADVKDKRAGKIFMDAISNEKYTSIKKNILSICWESSIDFSEFISTFIDCMIQSDFETSFEAFTVIENLTEPISEEIKQLQQEKLKDAIAISSEDKKRILHEVIHLLDQH